MPKFLSSNPLFVDLFYGVVVGTAISRLSLDQGFALVYLLLWVLAVLEDWYLYYSQVVDKPGEAVSWTFKSLIIEFAILTSWYLAFDALAEKPVSPLFFVCAGAFYAIKILGGVTFYAKKGELFSRRMAYDCIWFAPIAVAFIFYFCPTLDLTTSLWIFAGVTFASLVVWWTLTKLYPPSRNAN